MVFTPSERKNTRVVSTSFPTGSPSTVAFNLISKVLNSCIVLPFSQVSFLRVLLEFSTKGFQIKTRRVLRWAQPRALALRWNSQSYSSFLIGKFLTWFSSQLMLQVRIPFRWTNVVNKVVILKLSPHVKDFSGLRVDLFDLFSLALLLQFLLAKRLQWSEVYWLIL